MTINLKIEILKVFVLEFSFSSDKDKKEEGNEEEHSVDLLDAIKSGSTG